MTLSKAALMREKKRQGMSVGDIGRLFGVSYHYAYNTVVTNAGANARTAAGRPSGSTAPRRLTSAALLPEEAADLSWPDLLQTIDADAHTKAERMSRAIATREADRRDPTGKWMKKLQS